jgi:hypothetical protein
MKDRDIDYSDIPEIDEKYFADAVILELPKKHTAKHIAKQMIQFNKTAFDNTFNAMTAMQEQTEKMIATYLEQAPWIPAEGKKAIKNWIKAYQQGREDFRSITENSYIEMVETFAKIKETPKARKR